MSDYTDRKLPREDPRAKGVVHILYVGSTLCGMGEGMFPGEWPVGHVWTYLHDLENVTCETCLAEAKKAR